MSGAANVRKHLPDPNHFIGKLVPRHPNYRIIERIGSGNNGHVYRAHAEGISGDLAVKFVPTENLPKDDATRDSYLAEARKANSLQNQCAVRCIDVVPWEDLVLDRQFILFVNQYIDGSSLSEFIKQNPDRLTVSFVEEFLFSMLGLLYEMGERGIEHGDLHAGNVLVSRSRFSLDDSTNFRVTDFGITEVTGVDHRDDYLFVAQMLRDLLERISWQDLDPRDRYVYETLRHDYLGRHLIETDPLADALARNARLMHEKLRNVDVMYRQAVQDHVERPMNTPFDYPNCEQMGSSHLLLKNLYSDRLLGLAEIRSRQNVVLTGPRGCGKTTVFRALSLDYLTSVDADSPGSLGFIGVYYRCDDLYFSFPRYKHPERAEAIDIPMHFFTVTLMAETLRHLGVWSQRHFAREFERSAAVVVASLWEVVGLNPPASPHADAFRPLISKLTKERKRAANKQRVCHVLDQPIEGYLGPRALLDFCRVLRQGFSFLQGRPFYFFVDDFSVPKITQPLQQNLNRLLMHRNADAFFKISTESPVSYERRDVDGKEFVEAREYDLLNLGLRYLQHRGDQVQVFLEDLFTRRFAEVEAYPCESLEDLLGSFERNENETARLFRERKGRHSYCGVQTITAMCSGDIHYMIRLVGRMVEDAGGREYLREQHDLPMLSPKQQSDTIRAAAGEFMESVRTLPKHGPSLAAVVTAIGAVAGSYLRYRDATNVTGSPPHQASRIEPYDPLDLTHEAQEILNELIRFSILLMDPRGKSRRSQLVPRFYLRRYLIPHFNLTFSRRDSIELENHEIEYLLTNPKAFQEHKRIKSSDDPQLKQRQDPNQGKLPFDADESVGDPQ